MKYCGNATDGELMLDNCFLRYDNSSFFSKLDTDGNYLETANYMNTNYLKNFTNTTFNLLSELSDAAYRNGENRFAEEVLHILLVAPFTVEFSVGEIYPSTTAYLVWNLQ